MAIETKKFGGGVFKLAQGLTQRGAEQTAIFADKAMLKIDTEVCRQQGIFQEATMAIARSG